MAIGFDIGGSVGYVIPDRQMQVTSTPRVLVARFGDGYEQRLQDGINYLAEEFKITINNRAKAEIDDIIAFFVTKGGVTAFDFTYWDSNGGGNETTIKVVASNWDRVYNNDIGYSCSVTFKRVYEA